MRIELLWVSQLLLHNGETGSLVMATGNNTALPK